MFSAYYWYRETLNISPNVESPQEVNWTIGLTLNTNYLFYLQLSLTALCLILSWVLVYLAMVKGITESPKVVYVTALFPYLVLIIFFIRAVTLRGMEDGIAHLFTPKVGPDLQSSRVLGYQFISLQFSLLLDPTVWLEAGTQIFFSLGLSFGSLIAYSSYNPVNNNCVRWVGQMVMNVYCLLLYSII